MPDFSGGDVPKFVKFAIAAIGIYAFGAILRAAEDVLAPLVLALVTGVILSPFAVSWERIGIPHRIGAMINLAIALTVISGMVFLLQPVAYRLVEQAPRVASDLQEEIRELRTALRGVTEMSKNVAEAITLEEEDTPQDGTAADDKAEPEEEPSVASELPSVTDALWLAPSILAQMAIFAGTLFFFMATRDDIYAWLARHVPWREDANRVEAKLLEAERRMARYFLTVAVINAGLGTAVFIVMNQIGLTGAAVWGLLAFLANFVLYLGPACFTFAMLLAGIATFDGGASFLPVVCYLVLNFIEAQFVTPATVGRQMDLNPLAVFLAVIFGIWLWGPIGGIVAIPLLVWVLVMNEQEHIRTPMG